MPTATSQRPRRNTDLTRANEVRLALYAQAAAQDDRKLARALRIVRAAIDLGIVDPNDLKDAA